MEQVIRLVGARENNLRDIDVAIPRNQVVCLVGVSGSGKSTIAFDIIAREGQRQYFESLPAYARRYLHKSNRPAVDEIIGVSASIVISQDRVRGNPRSTVGTLTEAYTYLRLLYSRVGRPAMDSSYYSFNHPYGYCPQCKGLGRAAEVRVDRLLATDKSLNEGAIVPKEWYVGGRQWSIIRASHHFEMDKKIRDYSQEELDKLLYAPPEGLQAWSGGLVDRFTFQGIVYRIRHRNTKVHRGPAKRDQQYFEFIDCPVCRGGRLNKKALTVRINELNIGQVAGLPISECLAFVKGVKHTNAEVIKPRLVEQLQNLLAVGVGYLALNRSADTLSGGEAQRVKMSRQLNCDLVEMVYVLDEPTAGLHPRDVAQVVRNLQKLRDKGNSVIVVEHDEMVIRGADYLIEIGPGGGKQGGRVVVAGRPEELMADARSLTGRYLEGDKVIAAKREYRRAAGGLKLRRASRHNLKNLSLELPTGVLMALTGVSGAGKSSLVEELVSQHGDTVVLIGQGQVGSNRRGCLATYVGAFDRIRRYFADETGMHPSLFSYNSHGGCRLCKGAGLTVMDMNFLGDIRVKCESCGGSRYMKKVLRYRYRGKNIVEVLAMTAVEAGEFFDSHEVKSQMGLLVEVGLDYMELGQTLDTLSGGESQRLKLASKLQARGEFYVLDEPTAGLHPADVERLMGLLNRLVNNGNTVLVVEHNLAVVKNADWVIDLGPEGGEAGGEVVVQGTPLAVSRCRRSHTGRYLRSVVEGE